MNPNIKLIETFYTAFKKGQVEEMVACYHEDILFQDPAFGLLKGEDAKDMWRMLIGRSNGSIEIIFGEIEANDITGKAYWEAKYPFSKTGRQVHNKIHANFIFKDGKIIKHTDKFNVWRWSSMALGPVGFLLGYTPIVKNRIRKTALEQLTAFKKKRANPDL